MTLKAAAFLLWLILLATKSGLSYADAITSIERIKPSIVVVGTYNKTSSPQFQMKGTGFVAGTGNLVATNAHVVSEIATLDSQIAVLQVSVPRSSVQVRVAMVVAVDKEHDLAILRFEGPPLPPVQLVSSDTAKEGQSIAFTGFPIGGALGFSPVTHRGMIASITPITLPGNNSKQINEKVIRQIRQGSFKIFQLDATAYPGNSGSPVFDADTGEVLGVINMVFVKGLKETALTHPSGISYAIPSAHLIGLLNSIPDKR